MSGKKIFDRYLHKAITKNKALKCWGDYHRVACSLKKFDYSKLSPDEIAYARNMFDIYYQYLLDEINTHKTQKGHLYSHLVALKHEHVTYMKDFNQVFLKLIQDGQFCLPSYQDENISLNEIIILPDDDILGWL
ncbi:hypothetical protein GUI12_01355 [Anaplasmataceae bacterium AB001_6]|nr:hypothetical protein GUI12_01355 [Anaplasmataceae bacterium AB001_6]